MDFAYKDVAVRALKRINREEIDPAYVIGFMRAEFCVLDHLDFDAFVQFACDTALAVDSGHESDLELIATSHHIPTKKSSLTSEKTSV